MKLDHRKVSKRKLINCRECQSCGAIEANANLRRHGQDLDATVFTKVYRNHCVRYMIKEIINLEAFQIILI